MPTRHHDIESSLLHHPPPSTSSLHGRHKILLITISLLLVFLFSFIQLNSHCYNKKISPLLHYEKTDGSSVESEVGVVAADDSVCSEIGASMLTKGGHAVDAAVAAAICSGVRHPMSSGIGGGAFIVVRNAGDPKGEAFDCRETAPMAASQNMYDSNPSSKRDGPLSMGIPGELAGLHAAWAKYGKLPWYSLFQPSIKIARNGFPVDPYLDLSIKLYKNKVMTDPGLRQVFAPNGKPLELNDICYNLKLAETLKRIAEKGPQVFYNGTIGKRFIEDLKREGGIATMEDMGRYQVEVTNAMAVNVMGFTLLGMHPPSSGTLGIFLVLNILNGYKNLDAVSGLLGLHRLIEAVKHMFAIRMNLGDPKFVNITQYVDDMLSPSFAEQIRKKIVDNTTFDPSYYLSRWSQLRDHGTCHISVVDAERNAVSMTTTINHLFGGMLSPSTGIVVNNEMDDFTSPSESTADGFPPAPANFIEPSKRPLSSMTPLVILKDTQLAGVIGASGGIYIIPAVLQVFLNHFVLGMKPLEAIQHPRFFHELIPNEVIYENCTALDGERIEFSQAAKEFLEERHHQLRTNTDGAFCQFVVHDLKDPVPMKKSSNNNKYNVFHGILTAVSDPRKAARPAGI